MKKNEIKEYLLNNKEILSDIICELNSWNLCLDYLLYYENDDEFFDAYPSEVIRATHLGNYNFNDNYVKFNGHGNVVSFNEEEINEEIKNSIDDIVNCLIEYHNYITINNKDLENLLSKEEN